MDVSKLEIGMVFDNYSRLCEFLEIKKMGGNGKKAQLNELSRFCLYEKDINKFIINEIYDKPIINIQTRNVKTSLLDLPVNVQNSIVNTYDRELYQIALSSKFEILWKCSSCNIEFKRAPKSISFNKNIKCKKCIQSIGSKVIYELLEYHGLNFELEYTFNDLKNKLNLRFDYAIFKNEKLITLIEYDGGYHDFHEGVIFNDNIKDDYCFKNNIPLLRVHHTDLDIVKTVSEYLLKLGLISNDMMAAYLSKVKLQELNKKLDKLNTKKISIEDEILEVESMIIELEMVSV